MLKPPELRYNVCCSNIQKEENTDDSKQEYHEFRKNAIPIYGYTGSNAKYAGMVCQKIMEVEISNKIGANKHKQSETRNSHRCGFCPRRLDTRLGTMYLMVPMIRNGGYIPFFVTERKRSEKALIHTKVHVA